MKLKRLNLLNNNKINPSDSMPTESFASNRLQEIDDGNYDEISNDPKSPAVITLDRCNVTP